MITYTVAATGTKNKTPRRKYLIKIETIDFMQNKLMQIKRKE